MYDEWHILRMNGRAILKSPKNKYSGLVRDCTVIRDTGQFILDNSGSN